MSSAITCSMCGAGTEPDKPCLRCGFVSSDSPADFLIRERKFTEAERHLLEMQEAICAAFSKRGKATYFADGRAPMNLRSAEEWLRRTILEQGLHVSATTQLVDGGTSTHFAVTGPGPNNSFKPKPLRGSA